MDTHEHHKPATGAEALLTGLKSSGIDYVFANAGTDFPPIIEAMARLPVDASPVAITVPHETAGVAMAHGHYLVTGRAQAVMFHVNVGLANAVMGVINAASDNIPVLVMSGRTPITETGRPGHRVTPIHYGQEMFDQTSLLRDVVKFNYELRYPEQAGELVGRAMALANSAPEGPVYLSLPREPLAEACPDWNSPQPTTRPRATPAAPDPAAIVTLADWLRAADSPTILCQRGDPDGQLGAALSTFATHHGIRVVSPFMTRNLLSSDHPNFAGFAPDAVFDQTDLLIVLDSPTPWIAATNSPPPSCKVVHIGPDPHFARLPMRGNQTDIAVQSDPLLALAALDAALAAPLINADKRNAALAGQSAARRTKLAAVARNAVGEPMGAEWLSHCISNAMGDDAVVFSDLGVLPGSMDLAGPNRVFISPHSGGLGWAMNAALGAQLADRERLVIACVGDGSYMFANPVAAHQIAEALQLPILTIVKNNAMWNAVRRSVIGAYPDGAAAKANEMPLTSLAPLPDFTKVAQANRAHAEKVACGQDLPAALKRAIKVIRTERRQALLDVCVAVSDAH
ncbi:thiamine pyrophosphate-requiring protein [Gymnodinialimonas phycosphaerae]|uniref:thiamine pyrophosphate-requiring protein n=1 Tax=Gymnodinialimonas phycosphaerae TaxID=2841589 RepID=UPI002151AA0C